MKAPAWSARMTVLRRGDSISSAAFTAVKEASSVGRDRAFARQASFFSMHPFFTFPLLLIGVLTIGSPSAVLIASGCSISSVNVVFADTNKSTLDSFYSLPEVSAHMDMVMASNLDRYVKDGTGTLSCVDARSDDPVIGTPGGDLAEFAMGLYVYNGLTNKVQSYNDVKALFQKFMDKHISASRPFYFHTDEGRLKQVFTAVGARLGKTVNILPHRAPIVAAEFDAWVEELVKSYAQGCGHIRIMIDSPAIYGLLNANIIQWLIRAFYEELWAADSDAKRAKLAFVVKLGSLTGRAIAIVSNAQGTCSGYSPAIPPSLGGSTLFVYTPSAAGAFRTQVMLPFFADQGASNWNSQFFGTNLDVLFTKQLTATLTYLIPANQSRLVSVGSTTIGSAVHDCTGVLGGSQVVDACGECGGTVKDSTKCKKKNSLNPLENGSVAAGIAGGILYLIGMVVLYFYCNRQKAANSHISH